MCFFHECESLCSRDDRINIENTLPHELCTCYSFCNESCEEQNGLRMSVHWGKSSFIRVDEEQLFFLNCFTFTSEWRKFPHSWIRINFQLRRLQYTKISFHSINSGEYFFHGPGSYATRWCTNHDKAGSFFILVSILFFLSTKCQHFTMA